LLYEPDQIGAVGEVAVVEVKITVIDMRILIEMVNTLRIKQGGSSLNTVNLIALIKQKLSKIGSILPRDTSYQSYFSWIHPVASLAIAH
jgi:hypothetical protein